MNIQKEIKNKFERNTKALALRPSLVRGTGISITRVVNGLRFEIKEGDWKFKSDMPEQLGGTGKSPSPGALGRAALGSCLATGYMMWASKLDIPIDDLEIKIEADYDDGGLLASSNSFPGCSEVRYAGKIQSPAALSEIRKRPFRGPRKHRREPRAGLFRARGYPRESYP